MTQTVLLGATKIKDMPFQIIDGDRGANYPKGHEFSDSGYCLFLSAKNVTKDGFEFSQKQFITKEKDGLLRKGKLERNDVVLTTRGTVGNVALYDDSILFDNMRINSGMIIIRCDKEKILPQYLYFVLKSGLFQDQVENFRSGSAQPQLPIRDMQNMKLPLPSLEEQKDVINQIGTIDEKIELNRKMNETLEQMGQALFRHYFIDNPEAEKWETKSLDEIADFLNGLAMQKYPATSNSSTLPVIKIREMSAGITANTDIASADIPEKYIVNNGDLLFSWSGTLLLKFWSQGRGALNQHLFKVSSDIYPEWLYYHWAKHHLDEFIHIAKSKATTMGHIQRKHLSEAKVKVPDESNMDMIGEQMQPLIDKWKVNAEQIQTLTTLRDTLLPRLINGKVKL